MKKEERVKELGGLLQHIANVMASLEKEIKPEPETAFQGIVRKRLKDNNYSGSDQPWDWIKGTYPTAVSRIHTTFNSTLELAKEQTCNCHFCLQAGNASLRIEALKEPTP